MYSATPASSAPGAPWSEGISWAQAARNVAYSCSLSQTGTGQT